MSSNVIVVDGTNVAYEEFSHDGKPKVANLVAVRKTLERDGFDPIIIIDASLRYDIDDPDQLEGLLDDQRVRQVPAGTDADYFVLTTAQRENAQVVSNDQYNGYQDQYGWIEERRIPFMIVRGEVEFYRPDMDHP